MGTKAKSKLTVRHEEIDIRNIEEAPVNANVMSESDFKRLVASIKEDGCLTSSVTLMEKTGSKAFVCISGHHRIKAAKTAGINTVPALILEPLPESTRIRLQLQHNDIHGSSDEQILRELQASLIGIDITLVDYKLQVEQSADVFSHTPILFEYVNICMKPETRQDFHAMIEQLGGCDNLLIEKEQYEELRKLMTVAFKKGFKTPGQAMRKFLDIVTEHITEITKNKE